MKANPVQFDIEHKAMSMSMSTMHELEGGAPDVELRASCVGSDRAWPWEAPTAWHQRVADAEVGSQGFSGKLSVPTPTGSFFGELALPSCRPFEGVQLAARVGVCGGLNSLSNTHLGS